jgi:hypothetical protein
MRVFPCRYNGADRAGRGGHDFDDMVRTPEPAIVDLLESMLGERMADRISLLGKSVRRAEGDYMLSTKFQCTIIDYFAESFQKYRKRLCMAAIIQRLLMNIPCRIKYQKLQVSAGWCRETRDFRC